MRAVIFFNVLIGMIFCGIVLFQYLLHRSMKRSLYNYRNVSFISGIIFGFVMMLSLYNYLIECILDTRDIRIYHIFRELIGFPQKFSFFAIPVFVIVCLLICISNVSLIKHEGLRMKNVLGFGLSVVFLGATVANIFIEKYIETNILYDGGPFDAPGYWVVHTYSHLFFVLLICYFEVYFIAIVIMGYLAAKQVPQYNKDYIIILGCSIDSKGGLLPLLKARTNRAIKYAWEQEIDCGKPVKFVPSGGQGPNEIISEGSAMELYLLSHGVEADEIIAEKESRNTYENFLFSKRLIDEQNPNAKICFATTNYHVYRSGLIAKRMGINIEGISSSTKWYFWPNGFVRECIAIIAMEKKLHIISIIILAVICIILGAISYNVFQMYWL